MASWVDFREYIVLPKLPLLLEDATSFFDILNLFKLWTVGCLWKYFSAFFLAFYLVYSYQCTMVNVYMDLWRISDYIHQKFSLIRQKKWVGSLVLKINSCFLYFCINFQRPVGLCEIKSWWRRNCLMNGWMYSWKMVSSTQVIIMTIKFIEKLESVRDKSSEEYVPVAGCK